MTIRYWQGMKGGGLPFSSTQRRPSRIWQSLKHTCVRVWCVCMCFFPRGWAYSGAVKRRPPRKKTGLRAAARASSTFCTELTLGFEGGDMKASSWGNLSPVKVATFVSTLVAGYFGVAWNHVPGERPSSLARHTQSVKGLLHQRSTYGSLSKRLSSTELEMPSLSLWHTNVNTADYWFWLTVLSRKQCFKGLTQLLNILKNSKNIIAVKQ